MQRHAWVVLSLFAVLGCSKQTTTPPESGAEIVAGHHAALLIGATLAGITITDTTWVEADLPPLVGDHPKGWSVELRDEQNQVAFSVPVAPPNVVRSEVFNDDGTVESAVAHLDEGSFFVRLPQYAGSLELVVLADVATLAADHPARVAASDGAVVELGRVAYPPFKVAQ